MFAINVLDKLCRYLNKDYSWQIKNKGREHKNMNKKMKLMVILRKYRKELSHWKRNLVFAFNLLIKWKKNIKL